jgi:hypothetical protein
MNFDTVDLLLIDILLSFGSQIESCHKKTLEYKFDLTDDIISGKSIDIVGIKNDKTSIYPILYFGFYNKTISKFCWVYDMNTILLDIIKANSTLYGSDKSWKKLLTSEVEINLDEHNAIPYLSALILGKYNLVKFENNDFIVYTMIKLDIDCAIDYINFYNQLSLYKNVASKESVNLKRNVNIKKKLLDNIKKLSKQIKKSPFKLGKRLEGKLNKNLSKKLSRTKLKKIIG